MLVETATLRRRYMNLGDVRKPPFFEDGKLKLEYEDGDVCKMRNITVPHIRTTISFICDFDAVVSVRNVGYLLLSIFAFPANVCLHLSGHNSRIY